MPVYDKPLAFVMGSISIVRQALDGVGALLCCVVASIGFSRGEDVMGSSLSTLYPPQKMI